MPGKRAQRGLAVSQGLPGQAVGAALLAIGGRESPALYWLMAVVCILLVTSTRNAWELLLQNEEADERDAEERRIGSGTVR